METTTIKKQQATKTGKKLFIDALDHLWKYYNLMYSDDSNEYFNELHDSLFCQLDPLGYLADSGKITNGDLDEIHKLLIEVVDYYKTSQKLKQPNWIYG